MAAETKPAPAAKPPAPRPPTVVTTQPLAPKAEPAPNPLTYEAPEIGRGVALVHTKGGRFKPVTFAFELHSNGRIAATLEREGEPQQRALAIADLQQQFAGEIVLKVIRGQ